MKRRSVIVSASLAASICFAAMFASVHAQAPAESIRDFQAAIYVNTDNSVDVTERIVYDTGPYQRHGIYRDVNPYSSEGRYMALSAIKVTDSSGYAYPWEQQSSGSYVRFKIGDPNQTFTGEKTYVISYHASNAAAHPKDVDEIYWNVTGSDWQIPIYSAEASVYLPTGVSAAQSACYYGTDRSTARCDQSGQAQVATAFKSPVSLASGQGLTVAVGFPKGTLPAYTEADNLSNGLRRYADWILAFILPLAIFIYMFRRWYRIGRDPKGTGVIVPQYDVPDALSPLEAACILDQQVRPADISAELVYLATRGYLKIKRMDTKILGFISTTDYEFELLKNYSDLQDQFDIALLGGIFSGDNLPGTTAHMSQLKNKFYSAIPGISDAVIDSVVSKGYYSNLKKSGVFAYGSSGNVSALFFHLAAYAVLMIIMFGVTGSTIFTTNPALFMVSIALDIGTYAFFAHIMPAKTVKGIATKEYILGLKLYLEIAEKDRLDFHNAPEKRPETFEKLLPYAMVLGVSAAWAKEFEGIYTTPPTWYEGYPVSGGFSAIAFNNSLLTFSMSASSSMASAPGGSGGGGFAGGGGGGGGGGGW